MKKYISIMLIFSLMMVSMNALNAKEDIHITAQIKGDKVHSHFAVTGDVKNENIPLKNQYVTLKVTKENTAIYVELNQTITKSDGTYYFDFRLPDGVSAGRYTFEIGVNDKKLIKTMNIKNKPNEAVQPSGGQSTSTSQNNSTTDNGNTSGNKPIINIKGEAAKQKDREPIDIGTDIMRDTEGRYTKEQKRDVMKQLAKEVEVDLQQRKKSKQEKAEEVKKVASLAKRFIESKELTFQEAKEILLELATSVKMESDDATTVSIAGKQNMEKLLKTTMKKSAVLSKEMLAVDKKGTYMEQDTLISSYEQMEKKAKEVDDAMENAGVRGTKAPRLLFLEIDESLAEEGFNLTNDNIEFLVEHETGFVVTSNGVNLTLEPEMLKELKGGVVFRNEVHEQENTQAVSTYGQKLRAVGKVYDLNMDVNDEKVTFEGQRPLFTIGLEDYKLQEDERNLLCVYVKNEQTGTWEQVDSSIEGDEISFAPSHFSDYTVMLYEDQFDDVVGHHEEAMIQQAAAKGIIKGRSKEVFAPEAQILRAEYVSMLVNEGHFYELATIQFTDVESDTWYESVISVAKKENILDVESGEFRPLAPITRGEMAIITAKYLERVTGTKIHISEQLFDDHNKLTKAEQEAVGKCREMEIIPSYEDNTYSPRKTVTRAEAVAIMMKIEALK